MLGVLALVSLSQTPLHDDAMFDRLLAALDDVWHTLGIRRRDEFAPHQLNEPTEAETNDAADSGAASASAHTTQSHQAAAAPKAKSMQL